MNLVAKFLCTPLNKARGGQQGDKEVGDWRLREQTSNRGGTEEEQRRGAIKQITGDEKAEEEQTDRNFRRQKEEKRDETNLFPCPRLI